MIKMTSTLTCLLLIISSCSKDEQDLTMESLVGRWEFKGRFVCQLAVGEPSQEYNIISTFRKDGVVKCEVSTCGRILPYSLVNTYTSVQEDGMLFEIVGNSIHFKSLSSGKVGFKWDIISYDDPFIEVEEFFYLGDDKSEETIFINEYVLKRK